MMDHPWCILKPGVNGVRFGNLNIQKAQNVCSVDIAHPHYHLRDNDTPPPILW